MRRTGIRDPRAGEPVVWCITVQALSGSNNWWRSGPRGRYCLVRLIGGVCGQQSRGAAAHLRARGGKTSAGYAPSRFARDTSSAMGKRLLALSGVGGSDSANRWIPRGRREGSAKPPG